MKRICFEDKGQDFLYWDIDYVGEVVVCGPFQGWLWVGCIVCLETLKAGKCLEYIHPRLGRGGIKYKVIRIEEAAS
jgi:hypothetical protein